MGNKYKYGRPKTRHLDQEKVGKFLTKINFQTESIHQEWRHLHAFGVYEKKPAVFKLATTQVTAKKTENEYRWNRLIHLIPGLERPHFTTPENYSSGFFGELFYFIAERFTSPPLATSNEDLNRKNLPIKLIAQMTREIQTLKPPEKYLKERRQKDSEFDRPKRPIQEKLLESATEWALQVPQNMNPFLDLIKNAKNLKRAPAHGDFVIRQMYSFKQNVIGIIDGEHSGIRGPKYYDVAQFYLRLRNDHNALSQARQYLIEFEALLSKKERVVFWEELIPVLTQRYIGDLWGAKNNPDKLAELKPLGQEILNGLQR